MYTILMFITGGRRGKVYVGSILKFVTGTEKEPPLGFKLHPSLFLSRPTRRTFCRPVILAQTA